MLKGSPLVRRKRPATLQSPMIAFTRPELFFPNFLPWPKGSSATQLTFSWWRMSKSELAYCWSGSHELIRKPV